MNHRTVQRPPLWRPRAFARWYVGELRRGWDEGVARGGAARARLEHVRRVHDQHAEAAKELMDDLYRQLAELDVRYAGDALRCAEAKIDACQETRRRFDALDQAAAAHLDPA